MSTTATISYVDKRSSDGENKICVKSIMCNYDGYPEGVGACLLSWYNDYEEVEKLINCGHLESIGQFISKEDAEKTCKPFHVTTKPSCLYNAFKNTVCTPLSKKYQNKDYSEDVYWLKDISKLRDLTNQEWNYLFMDGKWYFRQDFDDYYTELSYEMCLLTDRIIAYTPKNLSKIENSAKSIENYNISGIITSPIFDTSFYKTGNALRITVDDSISNKNISWINRPLSPFNAIILDVLTDKLLIAYYTNRSKKLIGKFAIPVKLVVDGTIKIEVIGR